MAETDASVVPDHRDFLFMDIGWDLMDLRQDIDFANRFCAEPYPVDEVIKRLAALQNAVGAYANQHFPVVNNGDF